MDHIHDYDTDNIRNRSCGNAQPEVCQIPVVVQSGVLYAGYRIDGCGQCDLELDLKS